MTSGIMPYNNGQIYYEVAGSGEPIVFIHGFTLDHRMWQPQVEFFSKDYQVVTYDARGFGKSALPNGPYDHTTDLQALLEHLKISQAHIVGLSMGGRIAINFALMYPEMVTSLTLMETALDGYGSEVNWDVHAKAQGIHKAKENWLNHKVFATTNQRPDIVKSLHTIVEGYSGWHWLHKDPEITQKIHARARLHEIAKQTLIIVGEGDLSYFHNISDVLVSGLPKAKKTVVMRAGHMVNMEAPSKVNNLLADFITHGLQN